MPTNDSLSSPTTLRSTLMNDSNKYCVWERGEVNTRFYGADHVTFAPLTPGKPPLDGLITDFLLDQTVQAWSHNSLMQ